MKHDNICYPYMIYFILVLCIIPIIIKDIYIDNINLRLGIIIFSYIILGGLLLNYLCNNIFGFLSFFVILFFMGGIIYGAYWSYCKSKSFKK